MTRGAHSEEGRILRQVTVIRPADLVIHHDERGLTRCMRLIVTDAALATPTKRRDDGDAS